MEYIRNKMAFLINNIKLKNKILLIMITCISLMTVFSIISIYHIISTYNYTLFQSVTNVLTYTNYDITKQLNGYERLSGLILKDTRIQEILSNVKDSDTLYTEEYNELYYELSTYLKEYTYINCISLYSDKAEIIVQNKAASPLNDELKEDIEKKLASGKGMEIWVTEYCEERGLILAREIRRMKEIKLDHLATLIINIDTPGLMEAAHAFNQYKEFHYLLIDQDGIPIYNPSGFSLQILDDVYTNTKQKSYDILKIDKRKYFAVCSLMSGLGWNYICLVPYDDIVKQISASILQASVLFIICIFIVIWLTNWLIHKLMRHFKYLILKIKKFMGEEESIVESNYNYADRSDEIGLLHQQFDEMEKRIMELIHTNYEKELSIKEAKIEVLETQINPHFLYNTLETINWRAKVIKEQEISDMVEALGNLLHATLANKAGIITLEQELDLARYYVVIQQASMDEHLLYSQKVPEELLTALLPKLIIQPLIENAVIHSMDAMLESCIIQITASKEGNEWDIIVKNNGSKFQENLLDKLREGRVKPSGHGICLLNIDNRIKLTYGEAFGLFLYNDGDMAAAKVHLPFHEAE